MKKDKLLKYILKFIEADLNLTEYIKYYTGENKDFSHHYIYIEGT